MYLSVNMCPPEESRSDCSIVQERKQPQFEEEQVKGMYLTVNIGPPEESRSDCSIDEERLPPQFEEDQVKGYRVDAGAEGACDELKAFSNKVATGKVFVGEYPDKINLVERIAGGSFGEVYSALTADGKKVAAKVEPQNLNGMSSCLLHEGNVYRNLEGGPGIPSIFWYGLYNQNYGVLVMDLLGPTLQDLFAKRKTGKFSLKTTLLLADQMLDTMEYVHRYNYVHRDISPANFMIGLGENGCKLYLIDFGHAKKFLSGCLIGRRNSLPKPRAVVGTPRFISINAHLSKQEGPRDDLESLAYILIYFLKGSLPWQGILAYNMPDKLNRIAEVKMETPADVTCKGIPDEFAVFLEYARGMKQFEPGNYPAIKGLFRNLADKHNISYDWRYDWSENEEKPVQSCAEELRDLELQVPDSSPEVSDASR